MKSDELKTTADHPLCGDRWLRDRTYWTHVAPRYEHFTGADPVLVVKANPGGDDETHSVEAMLSDILAYLLSVTAEIVGSASHGYPFQTEHMLSFLRKGASSEPIPDGCPLCAARDAAELEQRVALESQNRELRNRLAERAAALADDVDDPFEDN